MEFGVKIVVIFMLDGIIKMELYLIDGDSIMIAMAEQITLLIQQLVQMLYQKKAGAME